MDKNEEQIELQNSENNINQNDDNIENSNVETIEPVEDTGDNQVITAKGDINPRTNGDIIAKPMKKFASIFLSICIVIFTAFLVMLMITTNVYHSAMVVGTSMYPTINAISDGTDEKNDTAYYTLYKSAKVGDIVIVDYYDAGLSGDNKIDAIKRLIAKGGDTICYYGGKILRNGLPVDEWYLQNASNYLTNNGQNGAEWQNNGYLVSKNNFDKFCENLMLNISYYETTFIKECKNDAEYKNKHIKYDTALNTYVLTVPENYIFFLGDNRAGSSDCSYFGPVEEKYLLAKVDFILSYDNNVFAKIYQQFVHIFA